MRGTSVVWGCQLDPYLVFGTAQPDGMTMFATCIGAGRMEHVNVKSLSDHIRLGLSVNFVEQLPDRPGSMALQTCVLYRNSGTAVATYPSSEVDWERHRSLITEAV